MSSGSTATEPAGSSASSSAFARAMFSRLPSCSRCTGAIDVITPRSGRATLARSRIWPDPRIAISVTTTSVSGSIRQSVRGRPISLLKPAGAATVRRRVRRRAARMSFVDVFPTEPVIATMRASLRARTALPSAASAACAWSGTSAAAAPRARASSRNASPPETATNRSPGRIRRESTSTPVTASASPSSFPSESARTSASGSGIRCSSPLRPPCAAGNYRWVSAALPPTLPASWPSGRPSPPLGRRRERFDPRTPAPARLPCRR